MLLEQNKWFKHEHGFTDSVWCPPSTVGNVVVEQLGGGNKFENARVNAYDCNPTGHD